MNMPDSIANIIKLAESYMADAAGPRPIFNKSLSGGVEIEIKIPIYVQKDIYIVMDKLLSYGLCGAEHRSEQHYVYRLEDGAHLNRVLIKNENIVWLKIKSRNMPIQTSRYKFPAVYRTGEKLKPTDTQYPSMYEKSMQLPLETYFNKECLNFFYLYQKCIFSLSFSLAWNEDGFLKQEMEFEYEGHAAEEKAPNRKKVEEILEDMMIEIVPSRLRSRAHAKTKYEFLTLDDPHKKVRNLPIM